MIGLCTWRTQFGHHARLLLDPVRCRGMCQTRIRLLKAGFKREDYQG